MGAIKNSASLPSLDGITLETIVTQLSENMGWEAMATAVASTLLYSRSQHQIQLEILAQNTVGAQESGAIVFATSSSPFSAHGWLTTADWFRPALAVVSSTTGPSSSRLVDVRQGKNVSP